MDEHTSTGTPERPHPQQIVQELLQRPPVLAERPEMRPATSRRVAMLEREAPEIVERARRAGSAIEYLGLNPLFSETRLYEGVGTHWLLAPASRGEDLVVPRRERHVLQRLAAAKIAFPLMYIAHEVTKEQTKDLQLERQKGPLVLDHARAAEIVGAAPPPSDSVELSARLANRSSQLMSALVRAAPLVGKVALGIVAAPVVLVGGALAGLASLDPIILGAIPAIAAEPGEPAAWYVLARWEW